MRGVTYLKGHEKLFNFFSIVLSEPISRFCQKFTEFGVGEVGRGRSFIENGFKKEDSRGVGSKDTVG